MKTTYIIGHIKPDTDSVVSAMALEFLYKQKKCFGHDKPQAAIANHLNPETSYLFKKFKVPTLTPIISANISPDDRVVLVDHNETPQRLAGLNKAQIIEIIDHHKINLNLDTPIFLTFKPWGSTATIIYFLMKQNQVVPDKKLASLMLAAILSDTVGFKSATTTKKDKQYGQELAKIAQISELDNFTFEIFKAKSDLSTLSDEQIVQNDYKIYNFAKKTFISQLETVEQEALLTNKKESLLTAMANLKTKLGVELLFVAVTDILKINTKLLLAGEAEALIAKQAFSATAIDNVLDIGPKMSRKKEIAPAIEKILKNN
jgi:manganese-dependent inorganic pyrophosphatase